MVDTRVLGCAAPGNVPGQVNIKERLSKLKATSPRRKIARGTAVIATTKAASTIILAHALGGDELAIRMTNTPGINSLLVKSHQM